MEALNLETDIEGEFFKIKKEITPQLRELSELKSWKTILAIVFGWGVVGLSIAISMHSRNVLVYICALFVIAARQHGFLALMHEGVHFRLAQSERVNDFLSDWFNAYPIFMKTSIYRRHHLLHHRHLNTSDDPDWARKTPLPEWQFPMGKKAFLKRHAKYFWGYGIYEMSKLCQYLSGLNRENLKSRAAKYGTLTQFAYYSIAAAVLTHFHLWAPYFSYWIIPSVTILPLLMRIRSVAEHFGLPHKHILNGTRTIQLNALESFLVAPFNLSYHLDHHLFPTVPFYNLPKLNRILNEKAIYRDEAHQNTSYLGRSSKGLGFDLFTSKT